MGRKKKDALQLQMSVEEANKLEQEYEHELETNPKYSLEVDPEKKYNTIDIHYAYVGDGVSVQKSEKDITIVVPKVGANNQASNKLTNDIIAAINTATGLNIATLDNSAG